MNQPRFEQSPEQPLQQEKRSDLSYRIKAAIGIGVIVLAGIAKHELDKDTSVEPRTEADPTHEMQANFQEKVPPKPESFSEAEAKRDGMIAEAGARTVETNTPPFLKVLPGKVDSVRKAFGLVTSKEEAEIFCKTNLDMLTAEVWRSLAESFDYSAENHTMFRGSLDALRNLYEEVHSRFNVETETRTRSKGVEEAAEMATDARASTAMGEQLSAGMAGLAQSVGDIRGGMDRLKKSLAEEGANNPDLKPSMDILQKSTEKLAKEIDQMQNDLPPNDAGVPPSIPTGGKRADSVADKEIAVDTLPWNLKDTWTKYGQAMQESFSRILFQEDALDFCRTYLDPLTKEVTAAEIFLRRHEERGTATKEERRAYQKLLHDAEAMSQSLSRRFGIIERTPRGEQSGSRPKESITPK